MPPRVQPPEPLTLLQLQESINNLTVDFSSFRTTQDKHHESYLVSMESLQSQIPTQYLISPSQGTPHTDFTMKPPKLRLLPFDGTNPLN